MNSSARKGAVAALALAAGLGLVVTLAAACSSEEEEGSPTQAAGGPPPVSGEATTTPSGLKYIDIKVGTGVSPQAGQTVVVNYTGWLTDGTKFDSSLDRGQPFSFVIGIGAVINGWDEGVATMKVGGQRRLIIPPALGYGASGYPGVIPGNAELIFDVELLQVE